MEKIDHILKAGYVLTMDDATEVIRNGAVAVQGNRIKDVGAAAEVEKRYQADNVIVHHNGIIMPGLINTHTHAPMVYFRGMADDLPLKEWLERHIWPAEEKWLGPEFVRDASELACLEMLKAGITTYCDMYFFEEASAEAVHSLGIRAVLGAGVLDFPSVTAKTHDEYFDKAEAFIQQFRDDRLVTPCIAPHAPYTCGPDTYRRASSLADKYNIRVHTHLSETEWEAREVKERYGMSPVKHLASMGALNDRMLAAHCVWVDDDEIDLLAGHNVSVSHCLESNLKLASGIAPVVRMLDAGVRVAFGTDGAASNNDLNIISEMSSAAKLHKAVAGDPTVLNARQAVRMATQYGAEALGMGDRLGRIREGLIADIIMIDLERTHLTPLYDVYSQIVYAVRASDIKYVLVDGNMVVNEGRPVLCSEIDVMSKARQWASKIKG
jgi:5-methylthioadenosine/S-adenosylhomocysteine deaminase